MLRCKFRRGMFRLIVLNLLSAMFIPALNRKKTFIRRTDCGCMGPHAWRKTIEWDAEDFAKLLLAVDDISIERFFLLSHVLGRICHCLCRIRSHHVVACHTPCHERPYFVYTFHALCLSIHYCISCKRYSIQYKCTAIQPARDQYNNQHCARRVAACTRLQKS